MLRTRSTPRPAVDAAEPRGGATVGVCGWAGAVCRSRGLKALHLAHRAAGASRVSPRLAACIESVPKRTLRRRSRRECAEARASTRIPAHGQRQVELVVLLLGV